MAFKMRGNPFKQTEVVESYAEGLQHVGTKRTPAELRKLALKAKNDGNDDAYDKLIAQANRAETEQRRAGEYLKT
mgnify:CR=1 FL=1